MRRRRSCSRRARTGELPTDDHGLSAHLKHCARCRASAAQIERADAAFGASLGWAQPVAPEVPVLPEVPILSEQPILSPILSEQPILSKPPVLPEQPVVPEEPAAPEQPVGGDEPPMDDEPAPLAKDPVRAEPEGPSPPPSSAAAAPLATVPPSPRPTVVRARRGGLVGAARRLGKQLGGGPER